MLFKIWGVLKQVGNQTFNEREFKLHSSSGSGHDVRVQENDQTREERQVTKCFKQVTLTFTKIILVDLLFHDWFKVLCHHNQGLLTLEGHKQE